jgi:pyridoxal/pyridoxine/pyridoxamine kinase
MDAGGMDAPFPQELFNFIDIFSPNESELSRLTGIPTESFEQITQAVLKCHKMVSFRTPKTTIITKALFLIHCQCHFYDLEIHVKKKKIAGYLDMFQKFD